MTATMAPQGTSPATSPPAVTSVPPLSANHDQAAQSPMITSPPPAGVPRSNVPRPMSHASRHRLSTYSTGTGSAPSRSRPTSYLFPIFHSSLTYTIVRDFAYSPMNPMHYGPPPEPSPLPSGMTTPASESKRFSDPPASWEGSKLSWDWTPESGLGRGNDLAPIHFGDGPPYSEDDDLQSPVVSSRHRKHKSTSAAIERHRASCDTDGSTLVNAYENQAGYYTGATGDGSDRYYVTQGGEANGPGGEYVTYPPGYTRHSAGFQPPINRASQNFGQDDRAYNSDSDGSGPGSPRVNGYDESRYSRDYQFTITSPDEEMHGKAVALFDFERENENELPLVEGQIIWVSYRHGQGWLVAEDPKTQESGLVPEEYVRLLRDIEGGMNSLTGQVGDGVGTPDDAGTPTQAEHVGYLPPVTHGQTQPPSHKTTVSNPTNGYHHPVVSTFSTSSKDLDPYPQHLLGTQSGQAPPQVVHYHGQRGGSGSQANTPTVQNSFDNTPLRRGSQDVKKTETTVASRATETLQEKDPKSPDGETEAE